jgi:hypothetical protein
MRVTTYTGSGKAIWIRRLAHVTSRAWIYDVFELAPR